MSNYNRGYSYCQDPLGRAPIVTDGQNFIVVETIAALRAYSFSYASFPEGQLIYVKGYYVAGDGGGGFFNYHRSGTVVDDGGMIIVPDNSNGYFERNIDTPGMSVLWFGAKGDGVFDDSEAIQAAVDALPFSGGELVFPAVSVNYRLSERIVFDSKSASVLAYGANFKLYGDYTGFLVKGVVTKFSVRGGDFLGDGINRDADTSKAQFGWVFGNEVGANVQNVSAEDVNVSYTNIGMRASKGTGTGGEKTNNVWFVNCRVSHAIGTVGGVGYGLHLSQAPGSGFIGCSVDGCGRHGLYFSEGRNYTATGCMLKNHRDGVTTGAFEAFAISRCRNVTISNCSFDNNFTYGMNIDVDTAGEVGENVLDGVRVDNCVFRDSYSVDIQIGTSVPSVNGVPTWVSITNCTFIGRAASTVLGIVVRSGKNIQIRNNFFNQLDSASASRAVILLANEGQSYSDQIELIDNTVQSAGVGFDIAAAFITGTSVLRSLRNFINAANGNYNFAVPISGFNNNSGLIKRGETEERRATDGDTTPCVAGVDVLSLVNTGATVITQLDGGQDGQSVTLYFDNGNTTITDGTNIFLAGSANFVGTAQDTLTLRRVEGLWIEQARSLN